MRNPDRMWDFLSVLKTLDGSEWDHMTQMEFQIRLIQRRHYTPTRKRLTSSQVDLLEDPDIEISHEEATTIFDDKRYRDPPMRGRQSANPLKKFGLATFESKRISISDLGNRLLEEEYDLAEVFLRMMLKWQIPNPDNVSDFNTEDHDIKPFVGTLHLIRRVNQLEESQDRNPKGISRKEFCLFAPTLVHYQMIETYANRIVDIRREMEGRSQQEQDDIFEFHERRFAKEFLSTNDETEVDKLLNNLRDYGDNAIRYFRVTRYLHVRGGGYYVDLEPYRSVEIESLLESDDSRSVRFVNRQEFLGYIVDFSLPQFPWETVDHQTEIIVRLEEVVHQYESELSLPLTESIDPRVLNDAEMKERIELLSRRRQQVQDIERYRTAQKPESIRECIKLLDGIYDYDHRPILLERTASLSLCAFNDAIAIRPRYPVGDDNEPTNTAPGNGPDIECFYENFNAICEVTMLTSRTQWYNEGQPVMRHLHDFQERNPDKPAYCLFIAPSMHTDTINTFLSSIRSGYEGKNLQIAPLTIGQLVEIMELLLNLRIEKRFFPHLELQRLFDEIIKLTENINESKVWLSSIQEVIDAWKESLNS